MTDYSSTVANEASPLLPEAEAACRPQRRRLRTFFLIWLRIGAFSFGGRAATLFLLHREFVERHRWLTGDQYNEAFALSKLTPGTNLIAQSILMGRMMAGGRGIALALVGLMGPAVAITTLLAAAVGYVERFQVADAMLAGIVPATGGLLFAIVWQMGIGQLSRGWRRGRDLCVMALCGFLFGGLHVPVPVVIIAMAALGALFPHLADVGEPPATVVPAARSAPVGEEAQQA